MEVSELKRAAAEAAVRLIRDHTVVGLGSGSTADFAIRAVGERVRSGRLHITGVPTSRHSEDLAKACGISLRDPAEVDSIDLTIDGADEVDPQGRLIKGAGGAHVLEKIIAAASEQLVIIVDESKVVKVLGRHHPVPIEVVPPAVAFVTRTVVDLGGTPVLRTRSGGIGPAMSDLGHPIIDAVFGPIDDCERLDAQLNAIPGVVGHGLFIGYADWVLIGRQGPCGQVVEQRVYRG